MSHLSSVARLSAAILSASALLSCARGGYDPQDAQPADLIATPDRASDAKPVIYTDGPLDLGADVVDAAGPKLVVNQTTARIDITAAGRFVLSFEQQYRWQASGWRDLATSASINLGAPGPGFEHKVVQSPMLIYPSGAKWQTLQEMLNPKIKVVSAAAHKVVLETTWLWAVGPSLAFNGKAVHSITPDGQWAVTTTVTNASSAAQTFDVEYADTHLAPLTGWTATKASDDTSYKFVRKGVASPKPTFAATRPPLAEGKVAMDEPSNYYWMVSSVNLVSGASKSFSWTNRLWPGE